MPTPALAANAYAAVSGLASGAPSARAISSSPEGGFGDLLAQAVSNFSQQGQATEAKAMQAIAGRGDVVDVVTAVAESELALETLVSVRDKVIAAYEELMRMPI